MSESADRAKGALLGLAVGDALGVPLEFEERDVHPLVTEVIGGGPFDLKLGPVLRCASMRSSGEARMPSLYRPAHGSRATVKSPRGLLVGLVEGRCEI